MPLQGRRRRQRRGGARGADRAMALFFVAAIAIAAMPGPHWPDSPASIFASAFVDLPPTGPIFTRGALRPLRAKADGDSVGGCDGVGSNPSSKLTPRRCRYRDDDDASGGEALGAPIGRWPSSSSPRSPLRRCQARTGPIPLRRYSHLRSLISPRPGRYLREARCALYGRKPTATASADATVSALLSAVTTAPVFTFARVDSQVREKATQRGGETDTRR